MKSQSLAKRCGLFALFMGWVVGSVACYDDPPRKVPSTTHSTPGDTHIPSPAYENGGGHAGGQTPSAPPSTGEETSPSATSPPSPFPPDNPNPPSPGSQTPKLGDVSISSDKTAGQCLQVAGDNPQDGTAVRVADCSARAPGQGWALVRGQLRVFGDKCLDIPEGKLVAPGLPVIIQSCDESFKKVTQLWNIEAGALSLAGTAYCLALPSDPQTPASSQGVTLTNCTSEVSQRWTLLGGFKITPYEDDDQCIDTVNGSNATSNGTLLQIFECNQSSSQRWDIHQGEMHIGGKCLDLFSFDNGTPLRIWACTGAPNQQWYYRFGTFRPVGQPDTKCMDLTDGDTKNKTPVQIWDCTGDESQEWNLGLETGPDGPTDPDGPTKPDKPS